MKISKKSISKNYGYNLIYQILIMILPLVTTPYISRILGAENIGIYSYTLSIISYFVIFANLGVSLYGQREIAYLQDNKKQRSKTFWEIEILKLCTSSISLIIYYIFFASGNNYQIYYQIFILYFLSTALEIGWFFQGLEEFKKTVVRNIFVRIAGLLLIFIFVKNNQDLWKYILIYGSSELLSNISLWLYLPKYLDKIKIKELNIKQHIKPTIELFIPQISLQIYMMLDKTMLGNVLADKSEIGYYEQAQKIINLLVTVVTSLGTVMVPRMANTFANGDVKKVKQYINNSFKFTFFSAVPITLGILLVAKKFVPIFFGEGYEQVVLIINISTPIILLTGLTNVIGNQYLIPTKKQRSYTISIVVGTIVNCILNLLLIPYKKAIGAVLASIMAQSMIFIMQFHYIKQEISFKQLIKLCKNYCISGVLMFGLCYIIRKILPNDMIICIISGIFIYSTSLLLQKDELVLMTIEKIRKMVKK